MVKKKRVKMSTGQCVESHGHLPKEMGGAFEHNFTQGWAFDQNNIQIFRGEKG